MTNSLEKKEISVDQSPLDIANKLDSEDDSKFFPESVSTSKMGKEKEVDEENNFKLTICEQHKEKHSAHLNRNFKLLIDDLILSISPFIRYHMPYLLTENNACPLKVYLPADYVHYFKSNILLQDTQTALAHLPSPQQIDTQSISSSGSNFDSGNNVHEFLLMHLTKSFDNVEIKKMYADYKSRGGIAADLNKKRLILSGLDNTDLTSSSKTQNGNKISSESQILNTTTARDDVKKPKYDCLDIYMRQVLAICVKLIITHSGNIFFHFPEFF